MYIHTSNEKIHFHSYEATVWHQRITTAGINLFIHNLGIEILFKLFDEQYDVDLLQDNFIKSRPRPVQRGDILFLPDRTSHRISLLVKISLWRI